MPAKPPPLPDAVQEQARQIGKRIHRQRKALGVSAVTAAESAGVSRVTWHRVERGELSVGVGIYLQALRVLGLEFSLPGGESLDPVDEGTIAAVPLRIAVEQYPELRRLAWSLRAGAMLSPREAHDIYERNARHIQGEQIPEREVALMQALRELFGNHDGSV